MVKKSVLGKLSSTELESYLKAGNRFTPEAVLMAFEILKERGRTFSEEEKTQICQLIQYKKNQEELKLQEEQEMWEDNITEDPQAIKLFPRNIILLISFIVGTVPGSILLGINFIKLKKYTPAVFTFIFGFIYLPVQYFLVAFMHKINSQNVSSFRKSPEVFAAALGMLFLLLLWASYIPKKLPYRAASYIFPILISLVMIMIIYTNQNLFSSHFLVSLAR
ncbi:hypothetical protein [Chryseobacterium vrystaatense]|uniref:DUF1129 domain-containing protein n=1 Tax=Chryseobacterium vrystaatense TaxID=307480 RepID=A0ABR4UN18_9FLAO|nr:hypothetical protein [Chryseobacterium vrystaatense]KFF26369.1 hypothetical protein IW16_10920 [Chryseobacterium vrystaatense]